jgi:hypothetical protein
MGEEQAWADISSFVIQKFENMLNDIWAHSVRPSVMYNPTLSRDGNQWCFLYGSSLADGCAGFGDTIADAAADFDKNWESETIRKLR